MSLSLKTFSSAVLGISLLAGSQAFAGVVLDHNFQAATGATAGNLSGTGSLGTATTGTVTATGGFVSSTRPAWTSGSNGNANNITVNPNGSFNDHGSPAGNYLTATLAMPVGVGPALAAGDTTTVDFDMASFGTNNQNSFKYSHIIGYSSTGLEVFQLLYRAGSGSGTREAWARELGEDNTTFSGGTLSSVDGTKIVDNVAFGNNSTNTASAPSGQLAVSLLFDQNGWDAAIVPTGGGSTQTPATDLSIASGATDLATIVFFTSQNNVNGGQNNGLWVDDLLVASDVMIVPEPSSAVAILALAFAGVLRRRR